MNRKQVAAAHNANADRHEQEARNWNVVAKAVKDRKVRAEARRRAEQAAWNARNCRAAAAAQAW